MKNVCTHIIPHHTSEVIQCFALYTFLWKDQALLAHQKSIIYLNFSAYQCTMQFLQVSTEQTYDQE